MATVTKRAAVVETDGLERLLYTVQEAAAILGLSYSEVYKEIGRGHLRSLKVGKKARRISKQAMLEWIARREAMTAA